MQDARPRETWSDDARQPGSIQNDIALLSVVLCWAFNIVAVKFALREFEPLAFNIVRFACASSILVILTRFREGSLGVRREDYGRLVLMGILGHVAYQIGFIEGLARTTASSAALIFGCTPVVVALLSHLSKHEKVRLGGAAGTLLGFYGVYLIVGSGRVGAAETAGITLAGNLLIVGAMFSWAGYTVLARNLLRRYSPLRITTLTVLFGSIFLIPLSIPSALRQEWSVISPVSWGSLVYSFTFSLVICYILWYRSVKKVGNVRTAIYSNLVPVFGTIFGVWLLGDRLTAGLWIGAACILAGIVLTRIDRTRG
jgi:drug/metabolite transporter (DMT)-like permease